MVRWNHIPDRPWQHVTMDFMDGLPPVNNPTTDQKADRILVIVDRFSKMSILVPSRRTATAEEIYHIIWEKVFSVFGIPETITSFKDYAR